MAGLELQTLVPQPSAEIRGTPIRLARHLTISFVIIYVIFFGTEV